MLENNARTEFSAAGMTEPTISSLSCLSFSTVFELQSAQILKRIVNPIFGILFHDHEKTWRHLNTERHFVPAVSEWLIFRLEFFIGFQDYWSTFVFIWDRDIAFRKTWKKMENWPWVIASVFFFYSWPESYMRSMFHWMLPDKRGNSRRLFEQFAGGWRIVEGNIGKTRWGNIDVMIPVVDSCRPRISHQKK